MSECGTDETTLRLSAWLDDELPPAERAAVEETLSTDSSARRLVADWRFLEHEAAALPVPPDDASLAAALRKQVLARTAGNDATGGESEDWARPAELFHPVPPEIEAARWAAVKNNVLRRTGLSAGGRQTSARILRPRFLGPAAAAAVLLVAVLFGSRFWPAPAIRDTDIPATKAGGAGAFAASSAGAEPASDDEVYFAEVVDDRYRMVVRNVSDSGPTVVCFFLKETDK